MGVEPTRDVNRNLGAILNNLGRYDWAQRLLRYAGELSPGEFTDISLMGEVEIGASLDLPGHPVELGKAGRGGSGRPELRSLDLLILRANGNSNGLLTPAAR